MQDETAVTHLMANSNGVEHQEKSADCQCQQPAVELLIKNANSRLKIPKVHLLQTTVSQNIIWITGYLITHLLQKQSHYRKANDIAGITMNNKNNFLVLRLILHSTEKWFI